MDIHLLHVLLIFFGLKETETESVTTLENVSVQPGGSVSIPCLYSQKYKNNVKYLCKGGAWTSCSTVIKTNQPNKGKFSISDDIDQCFFTVTISHLSKEDTEYYWCIVEIDNGADFGKYFHLSVNDGNPILYVDQQELKGYEGGSVSVQCHHSYKSGPKEWCTLGGSCVDISGSIKGAAVIVSVKDNASEINTFTVTMSGLSLENAGWYWCSTGLSQMPVYIAVDKRTTTLPLSTTTAPHEEGNKSNFVDMKYLIISLSLLLLIVIVALSIWGMLKRQKKSKRETSDVKGTSDLEQEGMYSYVNHSRTTRLQSSYVASDDDVTYTTVVPKQQRKAEKVDLAGQNVIYSTLAHHHK